ncbi:MAG: polysaccharide deacetylase family protein, partial [Caulobacteraceae bacterium]|nr:polysaccharide deacetylase family protein [Caulobacter sp.]
LAGLDRIAALARQGHEIGCHTAAHGRLGTISRAAYLDDCAANAALLAPIVGDGGLRTFAYPFGHVRVDLKLAIQRRFRACRGIHDGLNLGTLDLGRLRADPLEGTSADAARIDALLDETVRRRGWRIFYSHDVCEAPTRFGVTPGLLAHAVAGALRRGCAVLPVAAALDLAGVP